MGEIFRELQEESKERETRGAFERWLTEKRGTPLLLEQTQAYEAFKAGMKHYGCMTAVRMFQAEEAVLAQPETEAEPVAWQRRYIRPEGPSGWQDCHPEDVEYYRRRRTCEVRPLYAHPPRDEWREAAEEALRWMEHARLHLTIKERMHPDGLSLYDSAAEALRAALAKPVADAPRDEWRPASEPPEDGRDVVVWCAQERRAVHGMYVRRHPPVVGLVDGWVAPDASKLTHWRDVTPPSEGNP